MKTLSIHFDNPTKSYFSGQLVSGRIVFVCDNEKKIRGLKVNFSGKASVQWTESDTERDRDGNTRSVSKTFSDSDQLFQYNYYVFGDGRSENRIPPGSHSYPFQFTLPFALPSSFEGSYGSVKYEIKAVMNKGFGDYTAVMSFTVNAVLDLNLDLEASAPTTIRKDKMICCLWCRSGPVAFLLNIPRRGYVPGERIPINAELTNMSRRDVTGVELQLIQTAIFHAGGKSKETSKTLVKVKRGGTLNRGSDAEVWQGKLIRIPPVCPSKLGFCRIIDVKYHLHFEMDISGAINLKGDIPLTIGTIPLRTSFQELMPSGPATIPAFNQQMIPEGIPLDLPPPSYEEAVGSAPFLDGSGDGDPSNNGKYDKMGEDANDSKMASAPENPFLPNYVTYGWNARPASQ